MAPPSSGDDFGQRREDGALDGTNVMSAQLFPTAEAALPSARAASRASALPTPAAVPRRSVPVLVDQARLAPDTAAKVANSRGAL